MKACLVPYSAMAHLRDRALVLRRTPFGESSLVVQVLTRRRGRVHLLAKGAYRPTSRFFCVLDLFDALELEWSQSPRAELALLHAGSVEQRRGRLTADLAAYRAALAVLELVELAARPGQAEEGLFDLCEAALDGLGEGRAPPDLTLVVFELGFLQNLGLAPALETCASCAGPAPPVLEGRAAFSAGAGGRLCRACAEEARAAGRRVGTLPLEVLTTAADLARSSPRAPAHDGLGRDIRERVRDLVERFLDYHLETRPKSHRAFLSAPNRNAPTAGQPAWPAPIP